MSALFSVEAGTLVVKYETGTVWSGHPDGLAVLDLRPAPDEVSAFVLLELPGGWRSVRNLVRVGADGRVLWRGELPRGASADCFVEFEVEATGDLVASTWSGYRVRLDPDTGALLGQTFTK